MYHTDLLHTDCADYAEKAQLTATSFWAGGDSFGGELVRTLLYSLVAN